MHTKSPFLTGSLYVSELNLYFILADISQQCQQRPDATFSLCVFCFFFSLETTKMIETHSNSYLIYLHTQQNRVEIIHKLVFFVWYLSLSFMLRCTETHRHTQKLDLMLMGTKCSNGAVRETKSLWISHYPGAPSRLTLHFDSIWAHSHISNVQYASMYV